MGLGANRVLFLDDNPIAHPEKAMVLLTGNGPLGFIAPSFPHNIPLLRIDGWMVQPQDGTVLTAQHVVESLDRVILPSAAHAPSPNMAAPRLIRGTPVLLQLVFLFDALPFIGIVMPPVTTAIIGFSLNEAAFAGEIIRGGILSVSRNQTLAAASLGMSSLLTLRRIVLPQAMRAILPAVGNDAISVLKGTSLASVIAVNELTLRSQQIVAQNFKFFPVFAAAGVMYLTVTTLIAAIQFVLERRVSPDVDRSRKPRSETALGRYSRASPSASAPRIAPMSIVIRAWTRCSLSLSTATVAGPSAPMSASRTSAATDTSSGSGAKSGVSPPRSSHSRLEYRSIFHPVSSLASRTFWPLRPMASESWSSSTIA